MARPVTRVVTHPEWSASWKSYVAVLPVAGGGSLVEGVASVSVRVLQTASPIALKPRSWSLPMFPTSAGPVFTPQPAATPPTATSPKAATP